MTNNTPPIDPALVSPEVWNQVQAMMLSMLQQGQLSVLPAPIVPSDPLPSPASLIPPDIVNPSVVSSLDSNMSDQDQSDLQEPPSKSPQAIICSKPNNPDDIDHPDKIDQPGQMNRDDGNVRDDDNSDEDFVPVDIDSNCKPQAVVKSPQDRLVPLALGDHHQAPPLITNLEEFDYTTGEPLDPPPVFCFKSMDDLVSFCQTWARFHGFAVAKSNSSLGKNMYIRCDRYGDYRGSGANPSGRQTSTMKIDCPFLVYGSVSTSIKVADKTWKMQLRTPHHNHEASPSPASHAAHRLLIPEQVAETVFPDSQANLCTWHLTKNITTHCKTHITGPKILDSSGKLVPPWDVFISLWKEVTYSKTPDIYVERYNRLKQFLINRPSSVLDYLEKNIFSNSTGDLLTVFNSLTLAVDAQLMSVHESIGKDTMKKLVNVPKVFMPLLGHISSFAIRQCKAQFDRLKKNFDPAEPCSQTLTKGVGIPCAHRIAELLETDDGLTETEEDDVDLTEEIHKLTTILSDESPSNLAVIFQHIRQIVAGTHTSVPIQAPNVKKNPKGRPLVKKPGYTSTTRDASAFEIVEANLEKTQRANTTQLKESQKASAEKIKAVKPTKKRVNRANNQSARRSKRTKKDDQAEGDEDNDNNEEAGDLPDLPDIDIAPSTGPILEDKEDDGSTYGEEVESAALLALLEEKIAVPDLILQVPRHLRDMVQDIFNPRGDGNCGFRCVAKALGYGNDGSDGFLRVRQEMMAEIEGHRTTYLKLQGGEEEVSKIIKGLTMEPSETSVPPAKWLNKMSHGQILANAYSRPIVFLSIISSNSFLPLRVPPPPKDAANPGPLYLLHVNGNHWALPHVEGSVKPIPPPILATRSTSKAAKGWLAYIKQGVASYNSSVHQAHFTSG
ncbi:hypothetical protein PSTG_15859 [Puccinia striiformis f. sp. tritici PST-78]|uniref:OTU domain-containing protein n=1 Tax=Puccinia striiformis f. sp. tritici PST-78 TaxID=1165861 RepID=A0A0L0UUJ8_9BASI|nr:hypothetical protein PSTG_15859 [Puccinia striiformis f. sp. tritici PST-78]